jgi:Zn-dependent protease
MAAIGTFVCLILHELGHAFVGRRFGIRIRSITLFIFGGVAELEQEPPSAQSEFWMAVAGPAVSGALAGGFWLLAAVGGPADWAVPVLGVVRHLALLNLALVGFNLVPAFPLDGGRVLRSILWAVFGDLRRATTVTTLMGEYFGGALLVLGLLSVLAGFLLPGLWWMMLGWFLQSAAQSSYEQVVIRGVLAGQPVRRFMTTTVSSVPPELDMEQLVEKYVYQQHHHIYPVRTNGQLLGYVTPREIKQVPRAEWPRHRVAEIMAADLDPVQIAPNVDAMEALVQMQRTGQTRLLVVEDGLLVGILTLKDLLDFLSLKIELEKS